MDFDGGITPEQAVGRIKQYDIVPNAWYPTFGDSPQRRKFRLIFFLDTLITNIDARNYLMNGLFMFYPEADEACKNPSHFFYGTNKQGQVLNHKAISLEILFSVLESDKIKEGGRIYKVKPDNQGAKFLRGICAEQFLYNNNIEELQSTRKFEQKKQAVEKLKENRNNKNVDWEKLQSRVQIFHDFMSSKKRLRYSQLLGIAQNLA